MANHILYWYCNECGSDNRVGHSAWVRGHVQCLTCGGILVYKTNSPTAPDRPQNTDSTRDDDGQTTVVTGVTE